MRPFKMNPVEPFSGKSAWVKRGHLADVGDSDFKLREGKHEADLHAGIAEADADAVVDRVLDDVGVFLRLDEEVCDFFRGFDQKASVDLRVFFEDVA